MTRCHFTRRPFWRALRFPRNARFATRLWVALIRWAALRTANFAALRDARVRLIVPSITRCVMFQAELERKCSVCVKSRRWQTRWAGAVHALAAFDRVHLEAGQSQTVSVHVPLRGLEYWSPAENKWVKATGQRDVLVGSSSRELPLSSKVSIH